MPELEAATGEVWQRLLAAEPMLQFFAFAHLPPHLGEVSRPFRLLAEVLVHDLPRNPERTVALRKLLEAKDAAVRARLYVQPEGMAARPSTP